jgi:hypothetical protein
VKYIVFPSYEFDNKLVPSFIEIKNEGIIILAGPTESGLFLIEGDEFSIALLKVLVQPYYLLMEDFESPEIN